MNVYKYKTAFAAKTNDFLFVFKGLWCVLSHFTLMFCRCRLYLLTDWGLTDPTAAFVTL